MCKWWALLFFLFISTTPSFGQATSSSTPAQGAAATVARTARVDATPPDAPFKIVRVMINSAEVEPDVPLQGGDDWFNQIRVVIKNTSRKNLVYATGQLRRVPLSFCVILTRQQRLDRLQDEFLVLLRHPRGENGSSISRSSAVGVGLRRDKQPKLNPVEHDLSLLQSGNPKREPSCQYIVPPGVNLTQTVVTEALAQPCAVCSPNLVNESHRR